MYANSYLVNLLFFLMLLIFSIRSEAVKNKPDRRLPFHEWIKQCLDDTQYPSMIRWISDDPDRDTFKIVDSQALSKKWRDYTGATYTDAKLRDKMRGSLRSRYGKNMAKGKEKGCYSFLKGYKKKPSKSAVKNKPDRRLPFHKWIKQFLDNTQYSSMIRWISDDPDRDTFKIVDSQALSKKWRDYTGATCTEDELRRTMRKSLSHRYEKGMAKGKGKGCYSFIRGYVEPQRKAVLLPWLKACLNKKEYSRILSWIEPIEGQRTFKIIKPLELAELYQSCRDLKEKRSHDLIRQLDRYNGQKIKIRNGEYVYSFIEDSDGQQQVDCQPANENESQRESIVTQECSCGDEIVEALVESDELKYVPATEEMTAAQLIGSLL